MVKTSYPASSVTLLLKDLTGQIEPLDTKSREQRIQAGTHYSQMLPLEGEPSVAYLDLYAKALQLYGKKTAKAVALVAEKILAKKGKGVVLVSLVRAGLPIGILIKDYLANKYQLQVAHYGISIIRGRGIDENAMAYILARHAPQSLQFVDGWIGKGAITKELAKVVTQYPQVDGELAVLADPAGLTSLYGTKEDFLIPSSCLNATVSGLVSRSILNDELIGKGDFHGAVYYAEFAHQDVSMAFIQEIRRHFVYDLQLPPSPTPPNASGLQQVKAIAKDFGITDLNLIKPGIGETTRVLLRRLPWKILVRDLQDTEAIGHILKLCEEKGVPVFAYPLQSYGACGLIQNLMADV